MSSLELKPNCVVTDARSIAVGFYFVKDMQEPIVTDICVKKKSTQLLLKMCASEDVYTAFAPQFLTKLMPLIDPSSNKIPKCCYPEIARILAKKIVTKDLRKVTTAEPEELTAHLALKPKRQKTTLQQLFTSPAILQKFLKLGLSRIEGTNVNFELNQYKQNMIMALKKAAAIEEGLHGFQVIETGILSKEFIICYQKIIYSWLRKNAFFIELDDHKPPLKCIVSNV